MDSTEIFDGDILATVNSSETDNVKVYWDESTAQFNVEFIDIIDTQEWFHEVVSECILIGNIHQNSELLSLRAA